MKLFTKSSITQKIIIAIIIVMLFNFMMVPKSYAGALGEVGGTLAKELMQLIMFIIDALNGVLNNLMLGVRVGDIMLDKTDPNITNETVGSWLYVSDSDLNDEDAVIKEFGSDDIDTDVFGIGESSYKIPNMLYSPENIFANNIAMLDINFLTENEYSAVTDTDKAEEKSESAAGKLSTTIASWYKSFRNIAIVGLLSVLIYLGIRILISSTAVDKAKYKETLKDWFVALCLVFMIHFIMSGLLMITDKVNDLFGASVEEGIIVKVEDGIRFRTNLIGLIRFNAQSTEVYEVAAYGVMYIAIFIYTVMFTFMYFKRFLYMAFFTMIAPLVALTYPIDRAGDGKAQAFNVWFKEYTMNVIIQPVHLIIYTVFVSSALDLAASNVLYSLVAIGFLIPAEKFIKSMFGLDKAQSTSSFGSFAGGALAMNALNKLAGMGKGGKKSGGKSDGGSSSGDGNDNSSVFIPSGNAGKLTTIPEGQNNTESDNNNGGAQRTRNPELEEQSEDSNVDTSARDMARQMERERLEEQIADGQIDPSELSDEQRRLLGYEDQSAQVPEETETSENINTGSTTSDNTDIDSTQQQNANMPKSNLRTITGIAGNLGKKVWKNKRRLIRGAAGIAGRAAGALGGAMIGVAAGITTGDMSKAFTYGAAGAAAGSAIGSTASNLVDGAVSIGHGVVNTKDRIQDAWNEEKYGLPRASEIQAERQNKRAERAFYDNVKEQQRYKDIAADIGYEGDYKNLMKSAVDYKKAGIDDDMIKNALKLEHKTGGIGQGDHDKYVDVARYASKNGFDKSNIEDEKKRKNFEDVLEKQVGKSKGYEVGKTLAALYDRDKLYESKSRLKPPTRSN